MMITTRTWAIVGATAALILVPAGVSYAVTAATDDAPPAPIERMQARDQLHDRMRDTELCDGHGPFGDGPRASDDAARGGMTGGQGEGMGGQGGMMGGQGGMMGGQGEVPH